MAQNNTNATETKFTCPVGLRIDADGNRFIKITSPRTGRTIEVAGGWTNDLPGRLRSRIAQAVSVGRHTAELTRDELAAFVVVFEKMTAACKPNRNDRTGAPASRPWGA